MLLSLMYTEMVSNLYAWLNNTRASGKTFIRTKSLSRYAFCTKDILTCHPKKITGVNNKT